MLNLKCLAPSGIAVLMALAGPAGAQDDPDLCANRPDLAQRFEAAGNQPPGSCPKVRIYRIHGDAGTACVLYFSDDDATGGSGNPALLGDIGRTPGSPLLPVLLN